MNFYILVFPFIFILTLALEDFTSERCYEEPFLSPHHCCGNFTCWSFNNKTHNCEVFIYRGCLGNGNRFESEEDCQDMCMETSNTDDKEDDKQ